MKLPGAPRYRWLFYDDGTTVDSYGEPSASTVLVSSGLFMMEKARNPIEVIDSAATADEIQYVLLGAWVKHHHDNLKPWQFAWCPALNRVVELIGRPVDPDGMQQREIIYVVDNIRRTIDTNSLPKS